MALHDGLAGTHVAVCCRQLAFRRHVRVTSSEYPDSKLFTRSKFLEKRETLAEGAEVQGVDWLVVDVYISELGAQHSASSASFSGFCHALALSTRSLLAASVHHCDMPGECSHRSYTVASMQDVSLKGSSVSELYLLVV